ncbi:GNAT family N-acetyltransferase [Sphaerisporangium corydalis]|uniref:GNAT family N-acetyltransferase n=1 Tax=Sphaerisporangium corydalis TaxID=1441875 RepID=A0ABV9EDB5_9ACTN
MSLRSLSLRDEEEYLGLVRVSLDLHHPWISLPGTVEGFRALVGRYDRSDDECLLVRVRETGAIAGAVHLNSVIRGRFQNASIAYAAFAPTVGQGYMSEAMALLIKYAFEELRLHRLDAQIQPGNKDSIKLVQRYGFRMEGLSPDLLFIDGAWRDHERWAITADMAGVSPASPHPTLPAH